jgi:hypothetical protein
LKASENEEIKGKRNSINMKNREKEKRESVSEKTHETYLLSS